MAIVRAIRADDAETVERLFAEHPDSVALRVPGFGTWLHHAASHASRRVTELIASKKLIPLAATDADGRTALVNAAETASLPIAEYLLDQGATIDVSRSGRNPLFAAIVGRSQPIAKLLLDRGIDSKVRYDSDTMKDMDAVAFAMMRGERDIAHMIALHNARGDEAAAQAAMADGLRIAHANTIPPGAEDDYAPSPPEGGG